MKNLKKNICKIFVSILFLGGICFFQGEKIAALTSAQQSRLERIEQKLLAFATKTKSWRQSKDLTSLTTEYCELTLDDINFLKDLAIEAFKKDDIVLKQELNKLSRILLVGDIHGDFDAAVAYVQKSQTLDCPVLFLGDYIDRGFNSYETLAYLYTQKALHPDKIFMIRGNHDFCLPIAESNSFFKELWCKMKGDYTFSYIHTDLCQVLDYLPLAAILSSTETPEKVYCAHAGIIPGLNIDELSEIKRPFLLTTQSPYYQMFWTDPDDNSQLPPFHPNPSRPGGTAFNREALAEFFQTNGLTKFVRGHLKSRDSKTLLPTPFLNFSDDSITTLHGCVDFCGGGLPGDCAVINGTDLKLEFSRLGLDFKFTDGEKPTIPSDLPPLPKPKSRFHFGGLGGIPIRTVTVVSKTKKSDVTSSTTLIADVPVSSTSLRRVETVHQKEVRKEALTVKPAEEIPVEILEEKHSTSSFESEVIEECHDSSDEKESVRPCSFPRSRMYVFSRGTDEDERNEAPLKRTKSRIIDTDSDSDSE